MFRRMTFLGLLLATAGGPYAYYNRDTLSLPRSWHILKARAPQRSAPDPAPLLDMTLIGELDPETGPATAGAAAALAATPQLAGSRIDDLRDVLRLDVSPDWVTQRWTRVTTVLADVNYLGLRVPLVTGASTDDLAGALTYYFDKRHRVRRVTFHGTTGEEEKLVKLLTTDYGFVREPHLGAGLYVIRWNGQPTSVLRIMHAPVVRTAAPHSQLNVMLEMNRPDLQYQLSPEARGILVNDHAARKW